MGIKDIQKAVIEAKTDKPPADKFYKLLKEAISRGAESRKPSKTYKPSSLGGCMRNMYYQVVGAEMDKQRPENSELIGMGESGTDRHERIQKAIARMGQQGYDVQWMDVAHYLAEFPQPGVEIVSKQGMETKLAHTILNMSFMCDGIFKFEGVFYILEIKTEASFKAQGRVQPDNKHITQACCYSLALGIDKIMFIYENRDVCSKRVFEYHVTQEDKDTRVIAEIDTCDSFVAIEQVPPMTTNERECQYCKYRKICKEDGGLDYGKGYPTTNQDSSFVGQQSFP